MKSRASQSSSSGWDGRSPCEPKFSEVADQAAAEEVLPHPVHLHSGGERMIRCGEPAREAEAVARLVGGKRRQRGGSDARQRLAFRVAVFAAGENPRGAGLGHFLHHRKFADAVHGLAQVRAEFAEIGGRVAEFGIDGGEIVTPQLGESGVVARSGGDQFARAVCSHASAVDFQPADRAGEEADVIDRAAAQAGVADALAEGEALAAAGVFGELVAHDFHRGLAAVEENFQAARRDEPS